METRPVTLQKRIVAGFWSYVNLDDDYESGRITRLRDRLERSIRFYSGNREFRIFQDRRDIGWGEKWADVIAGSLEHALLLFPVLTPSYLSSEACRREALAFHERQSKLGRDDLILPIYYLAAGWMDESNSVTPEPEEIEVAKLLCSRQYRRLARAPGHLGNGSHVRQNRRATGAEGRRRSQAHSRRRPDRRRADRGRNRPRHSPVAATCRERHRFVARSCRGASLDGCGEGSGTHYHPDRQSNAGPGRFHHDQ